MSVLWSCLVLKIRTHDTSVFCGLFTVRRVTIVDVIAQLGWTTRIRGEETSGASNYYIIPTGKAVGRRKRVQVPKEKERFKLSNDER